MTDFLLLFFVIKSEGLLAFQLWFYVGFYTLCGIFSIGFDFRISAVTTILV